MLILGWLALLLSFWTTADLVVDLAFEEPDLLMDLQATEEEPDNAAEHVLAPSLRETPPAADALLAGVGGDLDTVSIGGFIPATTALIAVSSYYPRPRSSPVSFSVPLRI